MWYLPGSIFHFKSSIICVDCEGATNFVLFIIRSSSSAAKVEHGVQAHPE